MVATFQYIEGVINTLTAAAEANRNTPTRRGNVIVLEPEDAEDVLITADLHGNRRNFNQIRKLADLENHPRRHLIMQEVCHGGPTYPLKGGCMSHAMLEDVAKLKVAFPDRVHFLLSNHELAELTDYPIVKSKKMLNMSFRLGMEEMYGPAADKVREAYLPFLRSCPLAVRLPGDVVVCHSLPEDVARRGFDPKVLERPLDSTDYREHGDVFRMVWGRDYRLENAQAFGKLIGAKVLIHGHEPCEQGYRVPNEMQVIIDCCNDRACCLLLPVGPTLSHAQVVENIQPVAK